MPFCFDSAVKPSTLENRMVTRTQAVKQFLDGAAIPDLAAMYHYGMEVQVNVAQDGGRRIQGEFLGKPWQGWTDDMTIWKSFRVPYHANTAPEYSDKAIKFDLAAHAEAIGMTGWNWQKQQSEWVAFDFDAIIEHAQGLSESELDEVRQAASDIPWVTLRKSTSGTGLHVYVHLDPPIKTMTHNEHAAVARAVIGRMAAITGFDFSSKVDICGGNMWVWHRKMQGTDGLTLLKRGNALKDVPTNWRDHIAVVRGKRRKNRPNFIPEEEEDDFGELCGQHQRTPIDEEHRRLMEWLQDNGAMWWWDSDHHMLVTHTVHLKEAHTELGLRGVFETASTGKERGHDHNCFGFPIRGGAWAIRRYTPGVQEHDSWDQDGKGWTRCYFNRDPDLQSSARYHGGLEDPSGGFEFLEAESAANAAVSLGASVEIAPQLAARKATLKPHKDGRLVMEIKGETGDPGMNGWILKKDKWVKIFSIKTAPAREVEVDTHDDLVRHIVTTNQEDFGWMVRSDARWHFEPLSHVRIALSSLGYGSKDLNAILGSAVFKCWHLVNMPFQPEYPGDRRWNRDAARLAFEPTEDMEDLKYPTWLSVLNHCGSGLDDAIKEDGWCQANGILTGGDYLKCWIAAVFQHPTEPLPYLAFWGPQNSGKSTFHEALSLLLTRGYVRADAALISQAAFNAELIGAILCVCEETDLRRNKQAYNKIKDWVTARQLLIHAKYQTPFHVDNTTHWIQCTNDHQSVPVFAGDTRITMAYVPTMDPIDMVPKRYLIPKLREEAPDFLAAIMKLEIPESHSRLFVPVIDTEDKYAAAEANKSPVLVFLDDHCKPAPGHSLKFSDVYDRFIESVDPNDAVKKPTFAREIPPDLYPKGRQHKDGQHYLGNITWKSADVEDRDYKLVVRHGYLEETA
jgi:hypothetical protein